MNMRTVLFVALHMLFVACDPDEISKSDAGTVTSEELATGTDRETHSSDDDVVENDVEADIGDSETILCGDSVLQGIETCDDGNTVSGDGCSDICLIEDGYRCGVVGVSCEQLSEPHPCDGFQCEEDFICQPNGEKEGECICNGPVDCRGVCLGEAGYDCNGVCEGDGVEDCFGVCDGDAVFDTCGICGGDGALCGEVHHCEDGLLNADEEGVDCGGIVCESCPPVISEEELTDLPVNLILGNTDVYEAYVKVQPGEMLCARIHWGGFSSYNDDFFPGEEAQTGSVILRQLDGTFIGEARYDLHDAVTYCDSTCFTNDDDNAVALAVEASSWSYYGARSSGLGISVSSNGQPPSNGTCTTLSTEPNDDCVFNNSYFGPENPCFEVSLAGACEDGVQNDVEEGIDCGGICPEACLDTAVYCGDGFVEDEEECDDGGQNDYGDWCNDACEIDLYRGCEDMDEARSRLSNYIDKVYEGSTLWPGYDPFAGGYLDIVEAGQEHCYHLPNFYDHCALHSSCYSSLRCRDQEFWGLDEVLAFHAIPNNAFSFNITRSSTSVSDEHPYPSEIHGWYQCFEIDSDCPVLVERFENTPDSRADFISGEGRDSLSCSNQGWSGAGWDATYCDYHEGYDSYIGCR